MRSRTALTAGGLVLMAMATTACQKVAPPANDTTPPIVTWTVQNLTTNDGQKFAGSGNVTVHDGDAFLIIFNAEDPEGIQKLSLSMVPGTTKSCTKDGITRAETADVFNGKEQVLHPDADGKVETTSIMNANLDWKCDSGWKLTGGSGVATGIGTNYSGGATSGRLTFTVPAA